MVRVFSMVILMGCALCGPSAAEEPVVGGKLAPPSNPTPRNHQTAEDLLRALQSTRPVSDVILPASRAGKGPIVDRRTLMPEGAAVVEQVGTLSKEPDGWHIASPGGQKLRVLPNAHLETMLAMQLDAPGMSFVVSGEITLFEDRNFVLIKHFERAALPARSETVSAADVASDASVEDVLSALERQRAGSDPTGPDGGPNGPQDRAVSTGGFIDGALIVRRAGRLTKDGGRWSFRFEDHSAAGAAPLAVLPNQSLEIMVHNLDRGIGAGAAVYVVSGETTQFERENYLLIRGVTRVPDTGNLRP